MQITFLGTGDAGRVPVYGCECKACADARVDTSRCRTATSIEVCAGENKFLIDAGQVNLPQRYPAGSLDAILLTHYHMDHVMGLFQLRWGENTKLPVYGPEDEKGCDDLYKHTGILCFKPPLSAFQSFSLAGISVTPVPLQHSRPCFGYLLEHGEQRIAYLTDTVGLGDNTVSFIGSFHPHVMIIDCTHPPTHVQPRNHNNWILVDEIRQKLQPKTTVLTHLSHDMDCWLADHPLPAGVMVAKDNMVIRIAVDGNIRTSANG